MTFWDMHVQLQLRPGTTRAAYGQDSHLASMSQKQRPSAGLPADTGSCSSGSTHPHMYPLAHTHLAGLLPLPPVGESALH